MSSKLLVLLCNLFVHTSISTGSRSLPPGLENTGTEANSKRAFDVNLYEDVIDEHLCEEQLEFMSNDSVRFKFLDASARLPHGILTGNVNDLGNYHQCLAISEEIEDMLFEGKYCTILVPYEQDPISVPTLAPSTESPVNTEVTDYPDEITDSPNETEIPDETDSPDEITDAPDEIETPEESRQRINYRMRKQMHSLFGIGYSDTVTKKDPALRVPPLVVMASFGTTLAFCIPKVCSTRQAIDYVQRQFLILDFDYNEYYCRLPNDKPFAPADYTAVVIFGILILLVIASTIYDLHHIFLLKRDPKKANVLYRCFSVYTNLIRMLTFNKSPGSLDCLDGIRAISMLWVIVGHTYVTTNLNYVQNLTDVITWLESFWSLWITSAPMTVDTFFLLSGILVVYTIISKTTLIRLVKTLHLYVANRMMRMCPLLAAVVLLQASLFNHLSDGPYWQSVGISVERCRQYWWSALLHIQNYVNPFDLCLGHSWYISVDTQLYLLAPIVMVFLFGSTRIGFGALGITLAVSVSCCAAYSFIFNFPSAIVSFGRFDDFNDYMTRYYINTLTRSPPFVIGMVYGYTLHIWRNKKIMIHRPIVVVCWVMSFAMMALALYSTYPAIQSDHDNQLLDNFINAFIRAIWAVALGWLILACVHGYGGPVNWFLSLQLWKLPARLSFAMFLVHFPLQLVVTGSWTQTKYFSNQDAIYRYMSDVMMTMLAAIALTLLVDAPFSTLQKLLMNGGGKRRPRQPKQDEATIHPEVDSEVAIAKASEASNGIIFRGSSEKTAL